MASARPPVCQIFSFQDCKTSPDPLFELPAQCRSSSPAPIVIDNGSFQTRAGWAAPGPGCEAPRLLFRSVAARSRGAARSETQIGNDIPNLEPLRWLLKSQFDRNVVVNFEIQELIFDYVFTHLGINSESSVQHPIVLTEAPCNPLHCRQMMSELLFECYQVPFVSYGVDGLYSFYHNTDRSLQASHTGIVLSSGYHCSHVLPVINGKLDSVNCKRVNVAGGQAASYLQRLLQLKYPGHLAAITLSRMEELLHEHSYTAVDYHEELEKWRSPEFYEREVHRMQLPFSGKVPGGGVSAEERQERRAQQLRRLQEINARRREEKLQQDQERLDRLTAVQELLEDGLLDQFHKSLVELNMDSAEELQSYISKLQLAVEQSRQKLLQDGADGKTEVSELEQPMDEGDGVALMDPDFPEDALPEKPANAAQPAFNMAEYHQLFVGTERLRCPEILFQPSLTGEDQMGLMETLQYVLARYSPEQQEALVSNVFLTGGNMQYPGMKERVERELLAMRPFQSQFKVSMASRPALDSWYGARDWAVERPAAAGAEGWISRQDYEEKGGEYLSEHCASNTFIPMKIAKPAPRPTEPAAIATATAALTPPSVVATDVAMVTS
ncbi:actin-related protein 5 [Salarias fasciatus]|uniref:Actin-related protein 5 n=1 Tax=Salarias fasciatus TaxID=181472 RepID=A0A672G351_SALFA|nr:actin-related protein 5 [Salarias fasciatus]